jgi:NET1-associated nuclear protein 1 (U3 small nucleolar RNA-associated protein 17)
MYGVGTYVDGSLCLSPRGDMLAFIGDETVVLVDFATQVIKRHKVKIQAPTCLAFHPQEACLAVGDISGSITLFWPQKAGKTNAISSTLHWHSHAVKALTFSRDGAYLLSGGSEVCGIAFCPFFNPLTSVSFPSYRPWW